VRGKDLFEQGRARARQADDENRIGVLRTPAAAACEKLAGANLDLLTRMFLDNLSAIPAFRALEAIAEFVVAKGLRKITLVLQRFTECKTQVIAINGRGGRRGQGRRVSGSALRS